MQFLDRDERRILKEENKDITKIPIKYKFFGRSDTEESSFYNKKVRKTLDD